LRALIIARLHRPEGTRLSRITRLARTAGCALLALHAAAAFAQGIGKDAAGALPIADVHFHAMIFMSPTELKQHMDAGNVRWAGGAGAMGNPPAVLGSSRDDEFQALLGPRYLRAAGFGDVVEGWVKEKEGFFTNDGSPMLKTVLGRIENLLKDGRATAIAEVHVNTRNSAGHPLVRRKVPADGPAMAKLMEMSARYGAPLSVHMQFDPDSVEQLQRLLSTSPPAPLVLAHCGKDTSAAQVRPILQKFPNVMCDLSYRAPPQEKMRDRFIFTRSGIDADWRALIEEMPDRFMVGVDDVYNWRDYDEVIATIREGLLANLSSGAAEKVASGNAVRLFKLK
jgi:predicted TIM-barrel fold metal-dependent hydrolase